MVLNHYAVPAAPVRIPGDGRWGDYVPVLLAISLLASLMSTAQVRPDLDLVFDRSSEAVISEVTADGTSALPDGVSPQDWASIRSQILASGFEQSSGLFAPTWIDNTGRTDVTQAYVVDHPDHGFNAYYGTNALHLIEPETGQPLAAFELVGFGYQGASAAVEPPVVEASGNDVLYHRGDLEEWYRNGPDGIEQGFLVGSAPPAGTSETLVFSLAVDSELTAVGRGREILLLDDGVPRLRLADLYAYDDSGRGLETEMVASAEGIELRIEAAGARYPIVVDPTITGDLLLVPSATTLADAYGAAVDLGSSWAAVGATNDDRGSNKGVGTVQVFERSGGAWIFDDILTDISTSGDRGSAVAVLGDTIAVGAPATDGGDGQVLIFDHNGSDWVSQGNLAPTTAGNGEQFGHALALATDATTDFLLVGAPFDDSGAADAGRVDVYTRSAGGGAFGFLETLQSSTPGANDRFGWDVAAVGTRVAVGAPSTGTTTGSVFQYEWDGPNTEFDPTLVDAVLTPGDPGFGWSVALSGSRLAVGVPDHPGAGSPAAGEVHIFGGAISPVIVTADVPVGGDRFGRAVDLFGDVAVVGAEGAGAGQAYVLRFDAGTDGWNSDGPLASPAGPAIGSFASAVAVSADGVLVGDPQGGVANEGSATFYTDQAGTFGEEGPLANQPDAANDAFGRAVAAEGDLLVVGAHETDTASGIGTGQVYVFSWNGSAWSLDQTIDSPFGSGFFDRFGTSVALSGDRLVIGAPDDDHGGDANAGSIAVYDRDAGNVFQLVTTLDAGPSAVAQGFYGWSVAVDPLGVVYAGQPGPNSATGTVFRITDVDTTPIQTPFTPSTGQTGAGFGTSVAASSLDRWAALAPTDSGGGQVYFFDGSAVDGNATYTTTGSGFSTRYHDVVAMTSEWVVVGAPASNGGQGSAATYRNNGSAWQTDQILVESGRVASGYGAAVATSDSAEGTLVGVVAPFNDPAGSRFIYNIEQGGTETVSDIRGAASAALTGAWFVTGSEDADSAALGESAGEVRVYPFDTIGSFPAEGPVIAIDGEFAAVGNPVTGTVWALRNDRTTGWAVTDTITGLEADEFGAGLALLGPVLVVGSPARNGDAGAVDYYLRQTDGTFNLAQGNVVGANVAGDRFGTTLTLDGVRLFVGAPGDNQAGSDAGAVHAYSVSVILASLTETQKLVGLASDDGFGTAIAAQDLGRRLWVGSPGDDTAAQNSGSVREYVYEVVGDAFVAAVGGPLLDGTARPDIGFGSALSASGEFVAVGAPGVGGGSGEAFLYDYSGAVPAAVQSDALGGIGAAVAISGDLVVYGAPAAGEYYAYSDNGTGTWGSEFVTQGIQSGLGQSVAAGGSSVGATFGTGTGATTWTDVARIDSVTPPNVPADKLVDPLGAPDDRYGFNVAIDGDIMVVTALSRDSATGTDRGGAYVYDRVAGSWTLSQVIVEAAGPSSLGQALALHGDVLVLGGSGEIHVYERPASTFASVGTFSPAGLLITATGQIDVDADTIVVGSPTNDSQGVDAGVVHVFKRSGGTWSEAAESPLSAPSPEVGDFFGLGVAVDGDRLVAGLPNGSETGTAPGEVHLFTRASAADPFVVDAGPGWPLAGTPTTADLYGKHVALDGDTLAVAAEIDDRNGQSSGAVYAYDLSSAPPVSTAEVQGAAGEKLGRDIDVSGAVLVVGSKQENTAFTYSVSDGTLLDTLSASDGESGDNLGASVAVSGLTAVLGAMEEDQSGWRAGAAYTFAVTNPLTDPTGLVTLGAAGATGDEFGFSVDIDINDEFFSGRKLLLVGAPEAAGTGEAYLYEQRLGDPGWTLLETFAPADGATGDRFGASVAVSGVESTSTSAWVMIGSPEHNGAAGAVYIYRLPSNTGSWGLQQKLDGEVAGDRYGTALDFDDDSTAGGQLLVGAPSPDIDGRRGRFALVHVRTNSVSTVATVEHPLIAPDLDVAGTDDDQFGAAVAIDRSERFVIGAPAEDGLQGDVIDGGGAYFFLAQLDYPGVLYNGPVEPTFYYRTGGDVLALGAGAAVGQAVSTEPRYAALGAPGAGVVAIVDTADINAFATTLTDPDALPGFGAAVDIEDGTVLIGVAGLSGARVADFDGSTWTVSTTVQVPTTGQAGDGSGSAIALADDGTVAVGAPTADTSGGLNAGGVWTNDVATTGIVEGKIVASGPNADEDLQFFGRSLDSDGTRVIVGAPRTSTATNTRVGTAYILEKQGNAWVVTDELPKPAPLVNLDDYARDVAIEGSTAMVVDPGQGVHIWEEIAGTWTHQQLVPAPDQPDIGGVSGLAAEFTIDLDGDVAIVGDSQGAGSRITYGHVLVKQGGTWSFTQALGPSERTGANPFADSLFGIYVAIDGDWIAIGASLDDDSGLNAGAVYLYRNIAGSWQFTQKVTGLSDANDYLSEYGIAIDGDTMLIGSRLDDAPVAGQGSAWILNYDPVADAWRDTQPGVNDPFDPLDPVKLQPAQSGAEWYGTVSLVGDKAAVGAPLGRADGIVSAEAVTYTRDSSGRWRQTGYFAPPDRESNERGTGPVAIVGEELLFGMPADANNNGTLGGAVYVTAASTVGDNKLLGPTTDALGAMGRSVESDGDTLVVAAPRNVSPSIREPGEVFVFERDPSSDLYELQATFRAPNPTFSDAFGTRMAISGDVLAITSRSTEVNIYRRNAGIWSYDKTFIATGGVNGFELDGSTLAIGIPSQSAPPAVLSGGVDVYIDDGSDFTLEQNLSASSPQSFEFLGAAVALDGDRLVAGAPSPTTGVGFGIVFERSGGTWSQVDVLEPDATAVASVGQTVALDGALAALGAPGDANGGAVYVFEAPTAGTDWDQVAKVADPAAVDGDRFGSAIDLVGDRLFVGADAGAGAVPTSGLAYLFDRDGPTSWSETQTFVASDGAAGDTFGQALAVTSRHIIVGAFGDDTDFGVDQGSAYAFAINSGSPPPAGALESAMPTVDGQFGFSVAAEGAWAVIGAPSDDSSVGAGTGAAYVSQFLNGAWTTPVALDPPPGLQPGDEFGFDVGIGDAHLVVGAPGADDGPRADVGKAYLYTRSGGVWLPTPELVAPSDDDNGGDRFGHSVDISRLRIAVGQPGWESDGGGAADRGRAYVYLQNGATTPSLLGVVAPAESTAGFGSAVDFDWPFLAIGAPDGQDVLTPPRAYVYTVDPSGVVAEAARYDGTPNTGYGVAVAASGNHEGIAIGRTDNGPVEIYRRLNGANWPLVPEAAVAAPGATNAGFGSTLDMHQELLVIGDPLADNGGFETGQVFGYQFDGTDWQPLDDFTELGGAMAGTSFASAVAIGNSQVLVGAPTRANTDGTGLVHPYELTHTEAAPPNKLVPPSAADDSQFGYNMAIDGEWAVVGAPGQVTTADGPTDRGTAYVYRKVGGVWEYQLELVNPTAIPSDLYGRSVAISGDTVAIGDVPETVHFWTRTPGGIWVHDGELALPTVPQAPNFANSIDLDGDLLVVGDSTGGDGGRIYAWQRSGAIWQELTNSPITAAGIDAGDRFGEKVAISGTTVVAGAWGDEEPGSAAAGTAHVFSIDTGAGSISFDQTLVNPDGPSNSFFGAGVDVDGNRIVVSNYGTAKAVHVFEPDGGGVWQRVSRLDPDPGAPPLELLGRNVVLSGSTVVASGETSAAASGPITGFAVAWQEIGGTWTRVAEFSAADERRFDRFGGLQGFGLALDGADLLVGAFLDDNANGTDAGAVYTYEVNALPANALVAADGQAGDRLGLTVALDGDVAVVGAPFVSKAYVFERVQGGQWTQSPLLPASAATNGLGGAVAVVSETLFVATSDTVYVFEQVGGLWTEVGELTPSGLAVGFPKTLHAGADGSVLVEADDALIVFNESGGTWSETSSLPTTVNLRNVGYDGQQIVVSSSDDPLVRIYLFDGSAWVLAATIAAEDATAAPFQFSSGVAIDDDVAIAAAGGSADVLAVLQRDNGGAWSQTGTIPSPSAAAGTFGSRLQLAGSQLVVNSTSAETVYRYRFDGSTWVLDDQVTVSDPGILFGVALALDRGTYLVGAPFADGLATESGAVFVFDAPDPDDPTLASFAFDTSGGSTADVGVAQIAITALADVQGDFRSDGDGTIIAAPLLGTDLEASDGTTSPLQGITLAQLALDRLTIDGDPLDTVLLSEVPIVLDTPPNGGWVDVLATTIYANVPLQNVTLADVYALDGIPPANGGLAIGLDQITLAEVNLAATPLRTISIAAVALAGVPLRTIDLEPGGANPLVDWCNLLAEVGYSCADNLNLNLADPNDPVNDGFTLAALTLAGVPLRTIPLRTIPLRTIDISQTPLRTIPLRTIDIGATPLRTIPLRTIELAGTDIGAVPLRTIPLRTIPLRTILLAETGTAASPLRTIPLRTIDLAASPLRTIPLRTIDVGASPLRTIPLRTIPLRTIPLTALDLDDFSIQVSPLRTIPLRTIPLRTIDIDATPLRTIPLRTIELSASPLRTIPLRTIPLRTIPLRTIPLRTIDLGGFEVTLDDGSGPQAVPLRTIPLRTIDLGATALASTPLRTIPLQSLAELVDCTAVNCFSPTITLGEAQQGGAILDSAAVETLGDLLGALHLGELADALETATADPEAELQTQIDDLGDTYTLGTVVDDAGNLGLDLGDLTLGDLPRDSVDFGDTELGDLGPALGEVDLGHVIDAFDAQTEQDLQGQLDQATTNDPSKYTLEEIESDPDRDLGDLQLGDLPPSTERDDTTLADLDDAAGGYALEDVYDHAPGEQGAIDGVRNNYNVGQLEGFGDGWEDASLIDILGIADPDIQAALDNTSLEELINAIEAVAPELLDALTLGDVLFGILGGDEYPWEAIDFDAVDIESQVDAGTIDYAAAFEVAGTTRNKTVEIRVELPLGASYEPESAQLTAAGEAPVDVEPVSSGDVLRWVVPVRAGTAYTLSFTSRVSLRTGSGTTVASASLSGDDVETSGQATIDVVEQADPGDTLATALVAEADTIYLQYVDPPGDVDLYTFEVTDDGTSLSIVLSNLPADYDLVLYGPTSSILPPDTVPDPDSTDPLVDDPGIDVGTADDPVDTELSNDIPSAVDGRPIIARSTLRDLADERIDTGPLRAGTHVIQVSGYNGATSALPYALRLKVFDPPPAPPCQASAASGGTGTPGTLPSTFPNGLNTLFIINQERFGEIHGSGAAQNVITEIDDLLASPAATAAGVIGAVLPVEGDPMVAAAYDQWDQGANFCDVERANDVVTEIASLIRSVESANPGIENIVVVGGDDVVPFARVSDGTTIANEQSYTSTFAGQNNAFVAAFAGGFLLTDDPYGDRDPRGVSPDRTFYLPDVALGRLVETPGEIVTSLDNYENFGGNLDPTTGYVAAYDFLSDGGQAIEAILDDYEANGDLSMVGSLISETWDRADLTSGLANATATGPTIGSVNAHFDHFRALPAAENAAGSQNELLSVTDLPANLAGSALFSMGCHAGLSVSDVQIGGVSLSQDWSQSISAAGGLFVGTTGYGYGDTEAVLYSERLMELYAGRLNGSTPVGQALLFAKQEYAADLAQTGVYDAKALMGATFYGLPFFTVNVTQPPPVEPPPAPQPIDPDPVTGQDTSTIVVSPSDTRQEVATGTAGTYYAQDIVVSPTETDRQVQGTHYRPIQPRLEQEISQVDQANPDELEQIAHGALITNLTTVDIADVDPVVSRPVYDDSANEPEPDFADVVFPAQPTEINTYLTPEGERQQLVIVTGQYRSEGVGTGTQRLFNEVETAIFYADPLAEDFVPPTFEEITATVVGGELTIEAIVTDDDVVERVFVLIADDPAGCSDTSGASCQETVWQPLDLSLNIDGAWTGSTTVIGSANEVEYLVQAVDGSGNVAVTNNKARNYEAVTPVIPDPIEFDIVLSPSAPNAAGWYSGDVGVDVAVASGEPTFTYELVGDGQGLRPFPNGGITLTGEGVITVRVVSSDGQLAEAIVRIDRSSPTVEIGTPVDGDSYLADTGIGANFTCRDTWSATTCVATVDGQPINDGDDITQLAPGPHSLTVTATDQVGRSATATSTFTITNAALPMLGSIVVTPPSVEVDQAVSVSADLDGLPGSTFQIDWGDTTTCGTGDTDCALVDPAGAVSGSVSGTHTYDAPGSFTVTIVVTDQQGRTDEATTTITVTAGCGSNLAVNGGFEDHTVPPGEWAVFTSIAGWVTTKGPGLEIQNFDEASEGTSHAELDSTANSRIRQQIATVPGELYQVSWDYRPAPGTNQSTNGVELRWDGRRISNQRGSRNAPWKTFTHTVTATDTVTNLDFWARGRSSGAGGLIDNVQVTCVENLLTNGSFEDHDVAPGEWAVLTSIDGWTTTFGPGLEVQNFDAAAEGTSHVELDSTANSGMAQDVPTENRARYILRYSYRPAPGTSPNTNRIEVFWNGRRVGRHQGRNRPWRTFSVTVRANDDLAKLEFKARGRSSGAGGLIDDVRLYPKG